MILTRVVSNDEWRNAVLSPKALKTLKYLFWRDPAHEETLKALSHEGKVCPVIQVWRKILRK